jgi:signal transduction histidine kinase
MASSISQLQLLLHDILRQDDSHGLDILVEGLAKATGAAGAILWTRASDEVSAAPSIVARWSNERAERGVRLADRATVAAFRARTLVLPERTGDATGTGPIGVLAALPVDEVDGDAGVLTLLGDGELTTDAFDVIVDLLDVLPELCRIVRERQGLALVRRCNDILQDADAEAAKLILSPARLSHYLGQVCAVMAEAVRCHQVSIHLRDPAAAEETFPLIATSAGTAPVGPPVVVGTGPVSEAIEYSTPVVECPRAPHPNGDGVWRTGSPALMAAPVRSGEQVSGAIVCVGTAEPRSSFTPPDVAMLTSITGQIARYWNTWLQRRKSAAENESWRLLATGVTGLNQLLSEQLGRKKPDDDQVYRTAVDIIAKVVSGRVDGAVWRPKDGSDDRSLVLAGPAASTSMPSITPPMTGLAFRSREQRSTADPNEISGAGLAPTTRWLVRTPLWVSHRHYGVLDAFGESPTVPPNSPQVCQIVGDQLGLYLHLRQSLHKLQDARTTLSRIIASQAETLEDLQHQLVSPLLAATSRTERLLQGRHVDGRTDLQLRAIRGLCRKSSRVAMSAGVFAALSKGDVLRPKLELLSVDDLLRLLIAGADDAQQLSNPRRNIKFTVDRDSVRALGRRFIEADRTFLEQCVGNIVDNAAKYSYQDTEVDIGACVEDGGFALAVTNVGITLEPADLEHCLQRDWRGAAARGATGEGSGIGLWIVDNLMRCMKGRVSIRPADDTTTVLLAFPLR